MNATIAVTLAEATELLRPASATPRLDTELLLAHALGWPRARLLAEGRTLLDDGVRATFDALVARRAALEPVAYIVGRREFFGLDFVVDQRVLVPRPETELLVELALAGAENQEPRTENPVSQFSVLDSWFSIADIGTGSGCIAVALAVHLPRARVYAVDIAPDTLDVARVNVMRHGVGERVTLLEGDLFAPLPEPVEMIVSNPPYTVLGEIDEGVRRHEPRRALDGGDDGLAVYRRLLAQSPGYLRPGGALLLEIGATQGEAVTALARSAFRSADVTVHKDLAGHDRVVRITTR
jgi:release factor glutamine methyltransferase